MGTRRFGGSRNETARFGIEPLSFFLFFFALLVTVLLH